MATPVTLVGENGKAVDAENGIPVNLLPGSSVLAESYIADLSTQKGLASGVSPEDGTTPVAIPSGAIAALIQVQGARMYWRPSGTTLNTARCNYLDPGQYLTIDSALSSAIFKGSASTILEVTFFGAP